MFIGPPIDDEEMLDRLSPAHRDLLTRANGYVAYHGGLHVRGACLAPEWHSLRAAWEGAHALHKLFPTVRSDDIPFGQDALGDQFLLRNGLVHRLEGETGDLESLELDLADFDAAVRADPVEYLGLQPLQQFRADGGTLAPGQLLSVYPPYVVDAPNAERSFQAIDALERIRFLAHLAAQIRDVPDGGQIEFRFE